MFATTLIWGLVSMFYLYLLYEMADEEIRAYTLYILDSCCGFCWPAPKFADDKTHLSESNHPLNPGGSRMADSANA